ncbi:MAG: M20/M25/M40 family metallo-hydrolase [Ignavibacteriales bacterium]|nr:MAG: M20/M25/M40 family metallo-hydrolase [Ignavibacteriales bacterium]
MRIKLFLLIVLIFNSLTAQHLSLKDSYLEIKNENLIKVVRYLSSKELEGRLSGSDGYNKAASFMANEFAYLDFKPMGDKKYFQYFNVEYNEILAPAKLNLIENNQVKKEFNLGKDYVFRGFTGSGHITAPLAFVGYGITNTKLNYDEYAGIDVKGKIVIAFKYSPKWRLEDKYHLGDLSLREKISNAYTHGAVAILFVSFPNDAKPQEPILSVLDGEGKQNETFPSMHIDIPVADEFLAGSGYTLKDLQTRIDSTRRPFSIPLTTTAEILATAKYYEEMETMNVVGMLEGSDPILKNEYLVVGAHLDHVGSQAGEIYAPGANDNASGSAAVLEMARTFAKSKIKPKRSIIFVLFACEEIGLYGAKHFVDNSPVPLEKIAAMINLDCVGYGDSIQVGNGKSAPALWRIARSNDSLYTKMITNNTWLGGGADATPFHQKGIPCAYFVTTNSYAYLHSITDTAETLNKDLFEKVVRLAYLTASEVANGNYQKEKIK